MKERLFRGDDRLRGEDFDPIAEGERYGLSPEVSTAIWARVRREATDRDGVCDEDQARNRFRQAAERIADDGGQVGPAPGKWTQVEVVSGAAPVGNALAEPVPGKTTLVLARASGRAPVWASQVPGRTTLVASQAVPDTYTPQDAAAFCRRYVSGAQSARGKLEQAIASRDHRAAFEATHALKRDLRLARGHLAHGLAHDDRLRDELAALAGPAELLLAKLPHMAAGSRSWALWGPDSAEWIAAIGAPAGATEPAASGETAGAMTQSPTLRSAPVLPAADAIAARDQLPGTRKVAHVLAALRAPSSANPAALLQPPMQPETVGLAHADTAGRAAPRDRDVRRGLPGIQETTQAMAALVVAEPATHRAAASLPRPRPAAIGSSAGIGWSRIPDPVALPAWATGVAALSNVVARRAATIFRRELADTDVDLDDPAIGEARDRTRSGEPLPDAVRRDMEARFGADFRQVRVHTDTVAARAAEALHASAFTLGDDIFFAAGAFAPSQDAGQRLLVHELTHVVQSQQGRVPVSHATEVSQPSDPLEQEAAAAYDRTTAHVAAPDDVAPAHAAPQPEPSMLLRAPSDSRAAQAPARVVPWLSWDAQLVVGFVDGFARASGKGFTPEARAKIERDFKDPRRVLEIYVGLQNGVIAGALDDLKDNVEGVVQIAGWLAMNLPIAGFSLQDLKDRYESLTDPVGKAARDKETQARRQAIYEGLAQFGMLFTKDPGIMADLGEEFGQAAGDHVAHLYAVTFANAAPSEKGRMIGHALGYLAMEIALLFVGPETLIAKAPAAAAKIARAGGAAVEAILRLMEKIPALRKLLVATGRLGKAAKTVSPEAKLLAHLEQAIIDKVLQQGLRFEEIQQLAKLDKAAAEKLLRELPAKDVLELEKQLGKAKLEELAKTQNVKEIQTAAKAAAAETAAAEKLAAEKLAVEKAAAEKARGAGDIPQLTKGTNREMLGQAARHVQALEGTAAQKADLFDQLAQQINKLSGGSWSAARGVAADGSHVFLGEAGEALVINSQGQLFRGSLQSGAVSFSGSGAFHVDFSVLRPLK